MFRTHLFKYIVSNRHHNVFIQNSNVINHLYLCQCMSTVKVAKRKEGFSNRINYNKNVQNSSSKIHKLSEKEFLVRLKNNPDRFGSTQKPEIIDEGDMIEERHFTEQPLPSQKLSTKQYADAIKDLIGKHKIKEAIDLVEVRMLKDDRVKPEAYIYNLLLGVCGRVGYTKKAFMMYNDMKKRGLKATGGTYTALFNACSNSPWPTSDGLTRAKHLYNIMIEKGYEPNETNYNVMIKTFGRCGNLPMAFSLVDEMYRKQFPIKSDTINLLLQACISDEDAGYRHALLVWRKLLNKKIKPDIFTYNLMLRCIRDCGLGNLEITKDVIEKILEDGNNQLKENKQVLLHPDKLLLWPSEKDTEEGDNTDTILCSDENKPTFSLSTTEIVEESQLDSSSELEVVSDKMSLRQESMPDTAHTSSALVNESTSELTIISKTTEVSKESQSTPNELQNISQDTDLRPDLMANIPHLGNLISLSEITKPEERLLLVGGCSNFLKNMEQHQCVPNIKTFTQLLDCVPSSEASEKQLLSAMKKLNVKPDISFFNMLIKKRSFRFDYKGAKEVLILMEKHKYRPNVLTYGTLALGCTTKGEALELLQEMKERSYSINAETLGAMLHQACCHKSISYVQEIMEICLRENIRPNRIFMERLEQFKKKCRKTLNYNEFTKAQEKAFFTFKARYKTWLEEVEVDDSEDAHPWQQYRQTNEGGSKYQWKDASSRFKQKHTSLFKVKTSKKHRY